MNVNDCGSECFHSFSRLLNYIEFDPKIMSVSGDYNSNSTGISFFRTKKDKTTTAPPPPQYPGNLQFF
jgi:hypothetical protein